MPAKALGEKMTRSPLRSVWPRPRWKPLVRIARRMGFLLRLREPRVAWHSSRRKVGALLGVMDAAAEAAGGEVGGKRGMGTKQAQELQTESFAGLFQGRLDREIGSDLGGRKAMSMENPKGDQGALVLGAVEVAGEEGDNVVQF